MRTPERMISARCPPLTATSGNGVSQEESNTVAMRESASILRVVRDPFTGPDHIAVALDCEATGKAGDRESRCIMAP